MGAAIFDYLEGDNNEKAYKVTGADVEHGSDYDKYGGYYVEGGGGLI